MSGYINLAILVNLLIEGLDLRYKDFPVLPMTISYLDMYECQWSVGFAGCLDLPHIEHLCLSGTRVNDQILAQLS